MRTAIDNAKTAASKLDEGSKERKALEKAIAAYGKEGKKNGVVVKFGQVDGGEGETSTKGKTTTVKFDLKRMGKDYADAPSTAGEVTGAVAHEGAVAADQKVNGNPKNEADIQREETAGATAQAGVAQGLNFRSIYGLWDPSWDPATAGAQRDAAIKRNADDATALDCQYGTVCK